jgi:hypothetical protein
LLQKENFEKREKQKVGERYKKVWEYVFGEES